MEECFKCKKQAPKVYKHQAASNVCPAECIECCLAGIGVGLHQINGCAQMCTICWRYKRLSQDCTNDLTDEHKLRLHRRDFIHELRQNNTAYTVCHSCSTVHLGCADDRSRCANCNAQLIVPSDVWTVACTNCDERQPVMSKRCKQTVCSKCKIVFDPRKLTRYKPARCPACCVLAFDHTACEHIMCVCGYEFTWGVQQQKQDAGTHRMTLRSMK